MRSAYACMFNPCHDFHLNFLNTYENTDSHFYGVDVFYNNILTYNYYNMCVGLYVESKNVLSIF